MKAIHQRSRSAEKLHRPPIAPPNTMTIRNAPPSSGITHARQNSTASMNTKNVFSPTALNPAEEIFANAFKDIKCTENRNKDALKKTTQLVAQTIQKLRKNDPLKSSGVFSSQGSVVKPHVSTGSVKRNLTPNGSRAKLLSRNPSNENYFSNNSQKDKGQNNEFYQLNHKEQYFSSTVDVSEQLKKLPQKTKSAKIAYQRNIENCFSEEMNEIMANTEGREKLAEKINESNKIEERRNNRTPLKSIKKENREDDRLGNSRGSGGVKHQGQFSLRKEEQSANKKLPTHTNKKNQPSLNYTNNQNSNSSNYTTIGAGQDSIIGSIQKDLMTPSNIQRALEESFNDCSSLSIFESNRQQERRDSNVCLLGLESNRQTKQPSIAEPLRKPSPSKSEQLTSPDSEFKKVLPLEKNTFQDTLSNGPPTFNREYILNGGTSNGFVVTDEISTHRKGIGETFSKQSIYENGQKQLKSQNISSIVANEEDDKSDRTNINKSGISDGTSNMLKGVCVQYPGLDDKDSIGKLISDLELSNREKEAEIFDLNLRLRDLQNEINQMKFRAGRQSRTPVKYSPNSKSDCFLNEAQEELNFKRNKTPNPSDSALLFCEQMKDEISSIINKSSFIVHNHQTTSNLSFDYEKKTLKSARVLQAKDLESKNMLYSEYYRESSDISSPINHEGKPHNICSDKNKKVSHSPAPFCPKSIPSYTIPGPSANVDTVQSMKGLLEELEKKRQIGGDTEFPDDELAENTLVVEEEEDEFGESTPENFRKKGKNMRKMLPKIVHSLKIDDTDCFQNELDIREFAIHHPMTKNPN